MPLPSPKEDETEQEFISRCVSWILNEDPELDPENEDDRKQAVAMAYSAWRKAKGIPEPKEAKFTFLVDRLVIVEGKEGIYKAHGFALHPVVTYHPGEPPRDYSAVKDEIIKAAGTLKGKYFDIDHNEIAINPEVNVITDSKWNFDVEAVEFWADIDEYLYQLIQDDCPVSVCINWLIPDQGGIKVVEVDGEIGIAPYGFEFSGLSILQQLTPGDPDAMIEVLMESVSQVLNMKKKIIEQNGEMIPKEDETKEDFMTRCQATDKTEEQCETIWTEHKKPETPPETIIEQGISAEEIKARITELAKRRAEIGEKLWPEAELTDEERAALTAEQETIWVEISALEKALAIVITGEVAEKLPEGYAFKIALKEQEEKTPGDFTTEETCTEAGFHWYDDACHKEPKPTEPPVIESEELVKTRKQLVEMAAEVATANTERDAAKKQTVKLREAIEEVLPPTWITKAWGMSGAARLLVDIRKTIGEFKE